ncbi:hypothetical protein [Pasteuria penetrans]|nr:hypothetical protein [Pasteuria penetrans]
MLSKYKENSTLKLASLLVTGGMIAVSSSLTLAQSTDGEGVSTTPADALS